MKNKITGCLLFIAAPFVLHAQDKSLSCADLKNGIFYNYPKNTKDQYVDRREGDVVHEKNLTTGDTSDWRVKWTGDCVYTLKYLAGNIKWDKARLEFVQKNTLVFEIVNTGPDYYVYKFFLNKVSDFPVLSDTMWINPKLVIAGNDVYKRIANSAVLRKDHFSDTSKYAVVYLYRPGKLTNGLANYPVYMNDDIIWIAQNNSGCIYKIFKEGMFDFKSRLFKDESEVKLDVKYGNTYYVKSMIHWTISNRLYNFKLEMMNVDLSKGQKEFEEVNIR